MKATGQSLYRLMPGESIQQGNVEVRCYRVKKFIWSSGGKQNIPPGVYTTFYLKDSKGFWYPMMSDTPYEIETNRGFVLSARGSVFIAGLGMGLILHNLRDKIASGLITDVTVVESCPEVIAMVAPYFAGLPIRIIQANIFTYVPDQVYDTIYFDIWPLIVAENTFEMNYLHRRFRKAKRDKNTWIDSWAKYTCQRLLRENGGQVETTFYYEGPDEILGKRLASERRCYRVAYGLHERYWSIDKPTYSFV